MLLYQGCDWSSFIDGGKTPVLKDKHASRTMRWAKSSRRVWYYFGWYFPYFVHRWWLITLQAGMESMNSSTSPKEGKRSGRIQEASWLPTSAYLLLAKYWNSFQFIWISLLKKLIKLNFAEATVFSKRCMLWCSRLIERLRWPSSDVAHPYWLPAWMRPL